MSKLVIVFSTYYNAPFGEGDYLFSDERTEIVPFTSQDLCDYFWSKNKDLLSGYIASDPEQYLSEKSLTDINDEIVKIIKDCQTELSKYLEGNKDLLTNYLKENESIIKDYNGGDSLEFTTDGFDWINTLLMLIEGNILKYDNMGVIKEMQSRLDSIPDFNNAFIEFLKSKDGFWLSQNLSNSGDQNPLDMSIAQGMCFNKGPWLYRRFSYYKYDVKDDSNDVSVYAVWPLGNVSLDDNGKKVWIEALTEQFLSLGENADVQTLYLILHDKDIEKETPFTIYSIDEVNKPSNSSEKVYRCVALFQHVDRIGKFLMNKKLEKDGKNKSLEDIKQFISKEVSVDHYATVIAKKVNIHAMDDPSVTVQEDAQKIIDKELLDEIAKLDEELREAID